jgi:hypothetical protein
MTLSESTELFLASCDWLTDAHLPAVTSLRMMSALLDQEINPPLMTQYQLAYRNLMKQAPTHVEEVDELARLLKR